ncbi:hypothetical protein VTO73DRAFT_10511 [Trametes versicolor]
MLRDPAPECLRIGKPSPEPDAHNGPVWQPRTEVESRPGCRPRDPACVAVLMIGHDNNDAKCTMLMICFMIVKGVEGVEGGGVSGG